MRNAILLLLLALLMLACSPLSTPAPTPIPPATATPRPSPTASPTAPPTPTATLVVKASPGGAVPTGGAATPTPVSAKQNPFGLMIGPAALGIEKRIALIKELGGVYFRPWDVKVDEWKGVCDECAAIQQSGLKALLTVRANGGAQAPTTPPQDPIAYKRALGDILDKRKPELLVVENEENSAAFFYTGTAAEYSDELKAACEVAHSKGIKCANGGLVSEEVVLLVWANYLDKNNAATGCGFARRALDAQQAQILCNARTLAQLSAPLQEDIAKGRALLQAYKTAGADYVNFHWYAPDAAALEEAVTYLRAATGLKALSNEMGQTSDNPNAIQPLLQKALDLGLPIVIWYSVDAPKARALNDADGSLRPTGQAFKAFVQSRFK